MTPCKLARHTDHVIANEAGRVTFCVQRLHSGTVERELYLHYSEFQSGRQIIVTSTIMYNKLFKDYISGRNRARESHSSLALPVPAARAVRKLGYDIEMLGGGAYRLRSWRNEPPLAGPL